MVDAVGQMDQVTQQNAALVEESAAAAESLKQQAQHLVDTVSVFKLAAGMGDFNTSATTATPRPVSKKPILSKPGPARPLTHANTTKAAPLKLAAAPQSTTNTSASAGNAKSSDQGDWESF